MKKCIDEDKVQQDEHLPFAKAGIVVDIERLKKSLASEIIVVPPGMSREERRSFILSFAK